jgi:hypothetical protein
MWYAYTMECYSAIKNNDILFAEKQMTELEIITLIKISQTEKDR